MTGPDLDWDIRHFVYQALVDSGTAPDAEAVAIQFGISAADARLALQRLHDAHALVLQAGSGDILMANPLSAVPTDYRVLARGRTLFANCAWDSLGIPAMLGADARIEARHPLTGDLMRYAVKGGQLQGDQDYLVHFALPFRQWYADIVDT